MQRAAGSAAGPGDVGKLAAGLVEPALFISGYVLVLSIPVAILTAIVAVVVRVRWRRRTKRVDWIVASLVPLLLALLALRSAWPWPFREPDAVQDMVGARGPLLAVPFAWTLSLLVRWVILKEHK